MFFSRSRVGWWEFSARLFNPFCCRCSTPGTISRFAAPYLLSLSVMMTRGTYCSLTRSLRKKRLAAFVFRRLCDPHIQHVAILIHGSPQRVLLAPDREHDLVHMPCVATARATTAPFIGVRLPKRANTIAEPFHSSRRSRAVPEALQHHAQLSEKRKDNHTAWLMISGGKRKPL